MFGDRSWSTSPSRSFQPGAEVSPELTRKITKFRNGWENLQKLAARILFQVVQACAGDGRLWHFCEVPETCAMKRGYRFFISTASSEKRPAAQINRNKAPPIIARFL